MTRLLPPARTGVLTTGEMERWFGPAAPVLYHRGFGTSAAGPAVQYPDPAWAPSDHAARDPRSAWETARDQDLALLVTHAAHSGWTDARRSELRLRRARLCGARIPNAMEAALRAVTWLEASRFIANDPQLAATELRPIAQWLLRAGSLIERRLHEVPLGGNHYVSHVIGLLYLGRLLPGRSSTDRWAAKGQRILAREILRQFHADGGGYEQSSWYQLFTLELALGAMLLLRGQGMELPSAVTMRLRSAAHALASLTRPDGTLPHLGDEDAGRLHRWGPDTGAREVCALAGALFDDRTLASAAAGATTAVAWLVGPGSMAAPGSGAAPALPPSSRSLQRTGAHVLREGDWHVVLWSRDPSPPAILAHGHADHNSVDVWWRGHHLLRDPGSGLYLGDADLRNRFRATSAHSTLSVDDVQVSPFLDSDLFYMPPHTRGRRLAWWSDGQHQVVATSHDGFRRLSGSPTHERWVCLDTAKGSLTIWDEVAERGNGQERTVRAWWHWGESVVEVDRAREAGVVRVGLRGAGAQVVLHLPAAASLTVSEPFPWSPVYGVIEAGQRSCVTYIGPLPFRMALSICGAEPRN